MSLPFIPGFRRDSYRDLSKLSAVQCRFRIGQEPSTISGTMASPRRRVCEGEKKQQKLTTTLSYMLQNTLTTHIASTVLEY